MVSKRIRRTRHKVFVENSKDNPSGNLRDSDCLCDPVVVPADSTIKLSEMKYTDQELRFDKPRKSVHRPLDSYGKIVTCRYPRDRTVYGRRK